MFMFQFSWKSNILKFEAWWYNQQRFLHVLFPIPLTCCLECWLIWGRKGTWIAFFHIESPTIWFTGSIKVSILCVHEGPGQTWKKLQAVQALLEDILLEITLFLGLFEANILYFFYWGWKKKIWGRRMKNRGFKIQNWG